MPIDGKRDHVGIQGFQGMGRLGRRMENRSTSTACGLAEEFQQDFHPFGGGGDGDDGAAHALQRAVGDFHFVAGLDDRGDGKQFFLASSERLRTSCCRDSTKESGTGGISEPKRTKPRMPWQNVTARSISAMLNFASR